MSVQIKSLLILHKYQPMLIPPLPWRSLDSGGYILTRGFLMRVGSNHLHRDALARAQNTAEGGLSQVRLLPTGPFLQAALSVNLTDSLAATRLSHQHLQGCVSLQACCACRYMRR